MTRIPHGPPDKAARNGTGPKRSPSGVSKWHNVQKVFARHFEEPDMQAVKAVYASYVAHGLKGQPVWPMLVGPPGSLKTVLLMSFDGLPETHIIDQLTPKTFISGYRAESMKDEQPAGLLFRIGPSGKIIIPDFSTILAINRDHRASILSDLRRIYDGMLRKEFGTGEDSIERIWRGRITFMAAGTGDIDRHYAVFASLGERFVLIRWRRAGFAAAQRAIKQDTQLVQHEVREVVHSLLSDLPQIVPALPSAMEEDQIPALGDFVGYCRTQVVRDSWRGKDIIDVPEAESATRISQQLCQLAKGLAVLDRRSVVNEEDWQTVVRVAFDCLPPVRRKIISPLIDWSGSGHAKAEYDSLPASTRRYAREELQALGVLDEQGELSTQSLIQLSTAGLL